VEISALLGFLEEQVKFHRRHLTQLAATLNKELNREQGGTSPGVIFSFWEN